MEYGAEEDLVNGGVAWISRLDRVLVIGSVGDQSEVLAPIPCHGQLRSLQAAARLVQLIQAGVSVAGGDFVVENGLGLLCRGGFAGRNNLADGSQRQKRGRNRRQRGKQKLPIQLEILLDTVLWRQTFVRALHSTRRHPCVSLRF